MGETTLQSRFCALETRYEISQKKKNVVSRVKNLPWRPLSRVDFVLWRPDMRLAKKKKCGLQSQKSSLETTLQSRFCALETRYEISKKKNVVSRVKNLPWRPLSRVDFVLWRPDMRLAKKKNV